MELNVQAAVMPAKCKEFIGALTDNMWSFVVRHGTDTGESPYVGIEAARDGQKLMVTWHTRGTGTYRLFTCLHNKRVVTLTKVLEVVRS